MKYRSNKHVFVQVMQFIVGPAYRSSLPTMLASNGPVALGTPRADDRMHITFIQVGHSTFIQVGHSTFIQVGHLTVIQRCRTCLQHE
jgi:hypothetical protein